MSAAILREAAALMRERAFSALDACGDEFWDGDVGTAWNNSRGMVYMVGAGPVNVADAITEEAAVYIGGMQPVVALALAGLLEATANGAPEFNDPLVASLVENGLQAMSERTKTAVLVATAYLGEVRRG